MFAKANLDTVALPSLLVVSITTLVLYTHFPMVLLAIPVVFVLLVVLMRNKTCSAEQAESFFSGFKVGGHRGSPSSFPENGMAGFIQAKKEGADLIEFDVALTKDGHAVLLHDDDLDRTTNLRGLIREKTLADLKNANIAANFKRTAPGVTSPIEKEGIPLLEDVVKWAVSNQMRMLFDVKDSDAELVQIIADLYENYNLYNTAIVCSFFPSVIFRIKKGNKNILTGLTWRQKFFSHHDIENRKPRYTGVKHLVFEAIDVLHVALLRTVSPWFLGADLLLTNNLDVSRSLVNQQLDWGRRVAVWTVNEVAEMHWMLETLKIPILTDFPYYTAKLAELEAMKKKGYSN